MRAQAMLASRSVEIPQMTDEQPEEEEVADRKRRGADERHQQDDKFCMQARRSQSANMLF